MLKKELVLLHMSRAFANVSEEERTLILLATKDDPSGGTDFRRALHAIGDLEASYVQMAEAHIHHFTALLRHRTHTSVRVDECEKYLTIWTSIKNKKGSIVALTQEERSEIEDASYSGDYDELVHAKDPTATA